eukprot:scaffold60050_cov87-Attheya_sp.AAC.1
MRDMLLFRKYNGVVVCYSVGNGGEVCRLMNNKYKDERNGVSMIRLLFFDSKWKKCLSLLYTMEDAALTHIQRASTLQDVHDVVERGLLTIYDGAMANYSCISSYNILKIHFEGHAWEKFTKNVRVKV